MSLPTDDAARKALPIFDGVLMYFPDAIAAVAAVSKAGNDQHNPGEPLHWARGKSMDQMNTALRHMIDHGTGVKLDTDGSWHLAKAAWRILAQLQLELEAYKAVLGPNLCEIVEKTNFITAPPPDWLKAAVDLGNSKIELKDLHIHPGKPSEWEHDANP